MAFNFTTLNPTRVQTVGSMTQLEMGIVTLSGGTGTITFHGRIRAAIAGGNSSTNIAYVSATSGNTATVTGNGSDQVVVIALIDGGL